MKQPHEDVAGTDRDDWMLELDTQAMAHRNALAAMGLHLQRATLIGNAPPITREVHDRISQPKIGDLVVEATYFWPNRDDDHRFHCLGILVEKRREWACTDAEWEAEDPEVYDGERPVEREAWYIQYGSKAVDICRWANCMFVALPVSPDEFRR